jgi:hypothetical protein
MKRGFIESLSRALFEVVDSANPQTIAARAAIDMNELRANVARVVDYVTIYEIAYDLMVRNPTAHPLAAFLRAVDSAESMFKAGPISDQEFEQVLIGWRNLCKTGR